MSTEQPALSPTRGRIVYQSGYRGNGRGIILSISGSYDPAKEQKIGGFIHVVTPGNDGHCDIAWPNSESPHISKHLPQSFLYDLPYRMLDEIASEEEIASALAIIEKAQVEAKNAADEKDRQRIERRKTTARLYAHLEPVPSGGYATAKLAAKNIRTELKAAFPGIKFSVTSDVFSGGDSVDVSWSLGPTTKEVEAITGKYQEGHFNGMEDIYEDNRENVFPALFGGAKYVHETRHDGEAYAIVGRAICTRYGITPPADGQSFWSLQKPDGQTEDVSRSIRDVLSCQSFPAGAVVTGIEDCAPERDGVSGLARYFRVSFTAPEQPGKRTETAAISSFESGASVNENDEKNGVEIRFSAKPASSVLDTLKANGWRWSRFSGCWYTRRTPESLAFARSIAGITAEAAA